MEEVGQAAGALAMGITLMASTIAWVFAAAFAVTGIGRALAYDFPRIPLAPGRRVKKSMWNRWGVVDRRNDYEGVSGMIEAYDVTWFPDSKEEPSDAQDSCWRCHMRPEPLLMFLIMRALGQRATI